MKTHKTPEGEMFRAADAAAARFSRLNELPRADRDDAFQAARLAVMEIAAREKTGTFGFWFKVAQRRLLKVSRRGQDRTRREQFGAVHLYGYRQTIATMAAGDMK